MTGKLLFVCSKTIDKCALCVCVCEGCGKNCLITDRISKLSHSGFIYDPTLPPLYFLGEDGLIARYQCTGLNIMHP